MAGLDPAIQRNKESSGARACADWMAASRAAMTKRVMIDPIVYS
jgi:hypothetical protein